VDSPFVLAAALAVFLIVFVRIEFGLYLVIFSMLLSPQLGSGGMVAEGRRIVFLLRLSPLVPFNLLNYALGLTTIPAVDYVIASVGMVPGTLLYAYGGKVTGEAIALAGQAQVPKNASYYALLLGGLAATVAATAVATRAARRGLRDV